MVTRGSTYGAMQPARERARTGKTCVCGTTDRTTAVQFVLLRASPAMVVNLRAVKRRTALDGLRAPFFRAHFEKL
jgi:hypothetical protein